MSYDLKIFRNEVRAKNKTLDFLEDESSVDNFSEIQIVQLRKRLKVYRYELESESESAQTYNYNGGKLGITATLTKNCLTFQCAGGNENGIFEIIQTATEFCDGELALLNLQDGKWNDKSNKAWWKFW